MAREQAELDRKTGTASGTSATATATNGGGRLERLTPYWPSILLFLVGVGIFWGLYTPGLRFSQMGDWSWDHWLWLLALWGIVIALIALNAEALGAAAKTLQTIAAVAMLLLFLGIPIWNWATSDTSSRQERERFAKSILSMPANGDSPRVSAPPGYAAAFTGSGFTTHCVYTDGHEGIVGDTQNPCGSGPMLYQYVRDTTGKPNSVTYKFVRPN
ncbi:MAG: hypothetical protein WC814_01295 [Candidatus Paceibacterota bacterium]